MEKRGIDPPITFRFRKVKDDDLKKLWNELNPTLDKADVIRAALRAYFGMGNVNTLENENNAPGNALRELNVDLLQGVNLEQIEKSAADIDDALNNLLYDF